MKSSFTREKSNYSGWIVISIIIILPILIINRFGIGILIYLPYALIGFFIQFLGDVIGFLTKKGCLKFIRGDVFSY